MGKRNQIKIECPRCHEWVSAKAYREDHQPTSPVCHAKVTGQRLAAMDYTMAGNMAGVLSAAGLVCRMPWRSWYWIDHGKDRPSHARYERIDVVTFEATAPKWAVELARRLSRDKGLARALGFTQRSRVVKTYEYINQKTGKPGKWSDPGVQRVMTARRTIQCDDDKVLPLHVRAKILRVASANVIARELIADDPYAAGLIIKESWE